MTPSVDAPRLYPIIVIFQQLGAIGGATVATHTKTFGFAPLFLAQTVNIVLAVALMHRTLSLHERQASVTNALGASNSFVRKTAAPTSFLEGLYLIYRSPYVLGICVISTFAEVVSTIMDFQMKLIAQQTYVEPADFAAFMGRFGQVANMTSLLFALIGTNTFLQRCGLSVCLVLFPLATASLVVLVWLFPNLWVLFAGMVSLKALGYALNGPAREMLYIRTSRDIKYKVGHVGTAALD